jgi:DNA repair exonuclease SbcCD ATPase subunit
MKQYLPVVLALALIVLIISLIVIVRNNDAQQESDAGTINDYSNQLSSAQTQISIYQGTVAVQSNNLVDWQSSALTFSNDLVEAETTNIVDLVQITNLTGQVAEAKSDNQALEERFTELNSQLTNQVASLTKQINSTEASLEQANKDYALLENRLRRDVAERVLAVRKFQNLAELKAQIKNLEWNPAEEISAQDFYLDLGLEVSSNGIIHVISPD